MEPQPGQNQLPQYSPNQCSKYKFKVLFDDRGSLSEMQGLLLAPNGKAALSCILTQVSMTPLKVKALVMEIDETIIQPAGFLPPS